MGRAFKSGNRPDLHSGTPPLEALKAIICTGANQKQTFSITHIDVSRADLHAKTHRLVLVRLSEEDRLGADVGKWIMEKEHVR